MGEPTSNEQHECRHCSGLCAGAASRCPYCKRWLRRDDVAIASGATAPQPQGMSARRSA